MKKFFKNSSDKIILHFREGEIKAGVAGSFLKRALGLSFHKPLRENEGLFFSFSRAHRPAFWNFGMRFPIDVVWMRGGKIIGVQKNIPPMSGGLKVFSPPRQADSALEVPAGTVAAEKIRVGDGVSLRNMVELHIISE